MRMTCRNCNKPTCERCIEAWVEDKYDDIIPQMYTEDTEIDDKVIEIHFSPFAELFEEGTVKRLTELFFTSC